MNDIIEDFYVNLPTEKRQKNIVKIPVNSDLYKKIQLCVINCRYLMKDILNQEVIIKRGFNWNIINLSWDLKNLDIEKVRKLVRNPNLLVKDVI